MPETYPKDGQSAFKIRIASSHTPASAGLPGPGEMMIWEGCSVFYFCNGEFVVLNHPDVRPDHAHQLVQIVGKTVELSIRSTMVIPPPLFG